MTSNGHVTESACPELHVDWSPGSVAIHCTAKSIRTRACPEGTSCFQKRWPFLLPCHTDAFLFTDRRNTSQTGLASHVDMS